MSALLGVAFCISPLVLVWLGYLLGRYGLPVEVRRRRFTDRRRAEVEAPAAESPAVEVYRYDSSSSPTN
ncbi:hypothetical protein K2Z83_26305 [Oscillochloris sp. ZM17-4]|uniref:hypothetical protein n=1 Tax=Oscillochloris sp. ZM17-4 TaxID=2866714 RepID=UPI001C73B60A|nr:hypothetical protein [Oscillochloris sp. ZM17-4]MBX0331166.1 hypothetical protein [Oscillochloris sp. ZM17-4]